MGAPYIRFRKPSLNKLMGEYEKLKSQTDILKEALEATSSKEIETRVKLAKKLIESFVRTVIAQADIIERFSPVAAKRLRFKALNWKKIKQEQFSKDYMANAEIRRLPKETRQKLINGMRNDVVDSIPQFIELIRQIGDMIFITCFDSIKRTRGKPPMEIEAHINDLLSKHFPECAKRYEGAWKSLESDNPDRFRHASTSMREIIREILGKSNETRKERLHGLSNSESEQNLMEALANTVEEIYRTLNKGTHSELEETMAILSIRITENILSYVLETLDGEFRGGVGAK